MVGSPLYIEMAGVMTVPKSPLACTNALVALPKLLQPDPLPLQARKANARFHLPMPQTHQASGGRPTWRDAPCADLASAPTSAMVAAYVSTPSRSVRQDAVETKPVIRSM